MAEVSPALRSQLWSQLPLLCAAQSSAALQIDLAGMLLVSAPSAEAEAGLRRQMVSTGFAGLCAKKQLLLISTGAASESRDAVLLSKACLSFLNSTWNRKLTGMIGI